MSKHTAALRETEWQGYRPTRQTVRKLRPDVLLLLKGSGRLDEQQVLAGLAIRAAFERLTADVACRVSQNQPTGRPPRRSPMPSLLKAIDHPEVQLYLDWVDEMGRRRMATGPIIDVLVYGVGTRDVDKARGKRNGDTVLFLREALEIAVAVGMGTRS